MRHLMSPLDFTVEELDDLFDLANDIENNMSKYAHTCDGKKLATCFYEPSTRTRLSFESAMLNLGGSVIGFSGQIVMDDSMEHLKYHYLNRKIVEVKLQEEAALPKTEGITILKQKGSRVRLEVDTSVIKINDALRSIDAEHVEDINISNIPLENIIMEIYRSEGRGAVQ